MIQPVPSRCLGCMDRVMPSSPHDCGGAGIVALGQGWFCDCPRPECRTRQLGEAPKRQGRKAAW
ncbi:hypothetical protein GA0070620_3117 [Micromonospora krabiensis]|uniref:Uncharacterized protein n=1 Tax=Micromonospora krabiensis TaxID=307121 RepID=A0A1C3N4V2_9ACTN|nr:hypothetical protein GA0070620_3117 [Micromonospora krabiensis]